MAILLMYRSHDMRQMSVISEHPIFTCIPRVDGLSMDPWGLGRHKFNDPKIFTLCHNKLGHPGSLMMQQILKQSHGHPLMNQKILLPNEFSCDPCSQGKLIVRPSFNQIMSESPVFLA